MDNLILIKKRLHARIIISFNIGIVNLKILSYTDKDKDDYFEKYNKSIKFPFYNKRYLSEMKINSSKVKKNY